MWISFQCELGGKVDQFWMQTNKGGLPTLKSAFIQANDELQVKKTYGTGDIVTCMSNCIHDSEYELDEF